MKTNQQHHKQEIDVLIAQRAEGQKRLEEAERQYKSRIDELDAVSALSFLFSFYRLSAYLGTPKTKRKVS